MKTKDTNIRAQNETGKARSRAGGAAEGWLTTENETETEFGFEVFPAAMAFWLWLWL